MTSSSQGKGRQDELVAHTDVHDSPGRKQAEHELRASRARQAFLVRLSDTLYALADPVQIQAAAARLLGEHLGASRVHYAELEPDGEHAVVLHDHVVGGPDRAGRYALADFPRLAHELRAGRTFAVDDVASDPRLGPQEKAIYLSLPVAALAVVPLRKQGRFAALLSVYRTCAHLWSQDELKLVEDTAERTCDAIHRAQAAGALRASEARYRQALEGMSEGYAILSPDWIYLFVNKVNAEQARSRPEDMVGRSMLEVIPGVERSAFFEAYRRCMEERTPQRVESAFTYEDGFTAWFEAVAEPVAEGISVRAQDITARKRSEHALRESEELVRTIAENSTQALVMMNERGYATYWNPALLAMTGYSDEELRSRPLHDLIHHHHPDGRPYPMAECPIDRALPENLDVRAHEDLFFRKDGTAFPVLCAASPIVKGGQSVGTVIEVRDITERKQAEQALLEADRRKDHFLAVLSHELRNPLTPIKNSLYVLGLVPPGADQARKALEVIERQVDQLSNLVDDLLDLTRITRGKVQLERRTVELNDLVWRSLEDHLGLFERSGVRTELALAPQPVHVDADPSRVSQVIGNLLHNAAKFTPREGCVRIGVSVDSLRSQALLRVVDSGVGMTAQMVQRLFEPFAQADETLDRSKGGLGLGLALVKQLVELHGGTVEAKTEGPGTGAEFRVRLPLATAQAEVAGQASPGPAAARRRLLLIEDNVDAADSLRALLELQGHEVMVAYNGPDGLARARECRPEIVLCDIGLPGMDGYAVARLLRADEALKGMRLIALSGYTLPDDLERAAAAGFEQHLAKPPSLELLEAALAAGVRGVQSRDAVP